MAKYKSDEVTVVATEAAGATGRGGRTGAAHLIVLSGTNVGQVFRLIPDKVVLGREEGVDIQMLDAGISRRHAIISRNSDGVYLVEDAGSRNGTFANNHRVERPQPLQDGDKIQIGVMTVLKFTHNDAPEADYAQAMYEAALRDSLTGIFNRRYFEERLHAEFSFADRHQTKLALLMLDLDHFKIVNDQFGHLAGDAVLKQLAELIGRSTRMEDVLTRYGGEEFAILCRETDVMQASVIAERIRHDVAANVFSFEDVTIQLTVSIGVAGVPDPRTAAAEDLVVAADEALYQAKERGRNCVVTRQLEKSDQEQE